MPPQDGDAERGVLGAMLLSKDAIGAVVETMLLPSDHYDPKHELIHATILDMYTRGDPVDAITVVADLTRRGADVIRRAGSALYIHELAANVPLAANADHYAGIVRDKALLRRLHTAGQRIAQWAYVAEGDVDLIVDRAQAEVMDAVPRRTAEDYLPVADLTEATLDAIDAAQDMTAGLQGVPTGFLDLDDLTGGLTNGQMVVVAARPSAGKSTLALDFCRAVSVRHHLTSCFFSLEMTRQEITTRIIAAESKVNLSKLLGGAYALGEHEWARIAGSLPKINAAPLYIDDSPNMTITEIRAKARRLKMDHDLRLIVIDYLQLMSSGKRVESRQVEVAEFSRQIKLLAKELGIPVVALSQLNRGPEQRTSKRPVLSDIRESGSLEQDADIVILLHREDMYATDSKRPGEADMIVAKHRNGPTRDITIAHQGHYARFVDMARDGWGSA